MGIVLKKGPTREYAYLAFREGEKIVHIYLGPVENPLPSTLIRLTEESKKIPGRFRSLFWDTSLEKIDLKRNARYVIERVLEFGGPDALNWIQRAYTGRRIIEVLLTGNNISEKSRNFWMIWYGTGDA
jgi:hypothetical protein